MIFMLGNGYRLPFSTVEVGTFERTHRHRTAWGSTWDEVMRFSVQVIGVDRPIRLVIANDNQKAASHG
jgi:hypothetical protein